MNMEWMILHMITTLTVAACYGSWATSRVSKLLNVVEPCKCIQRQHRWNMHYNNENEERWWWAISTISQNALSTNNDWAMGHKKTNLFRLSFRWCLWSVEHLYLCKWLGNHSNIYLYKIHDHHNLCELKNVQSRRWCETGNGNRVANKRNEFKFWLKYSFNFFSCSFYFGQIFNIL